MSTATNTPASAGDDDIHRSDVDRSDIDGTALDPAAHAFLDSLPSRLRVVRARAARTREDLDRKSTRLNSSHTSKSRMPSSA